MAAASMYYSVVGRNGRGRAALADVRAAWANVLGRFHFLAALPRFPVPSNDLNHRSCFCLRDIVCRRMIGLTA